MLWLVCRSTVLAGVPRHVVVELGHCHGTISQEVVLLIPRVQRMLFPVIDLPSDWDAPSEAAPRPAGTGPRLCISERWLGIDCGTVCYDSE
jgi:hypothetical protein